MGPFGPTSVGAQFCLGLRLEDRLLHADHDGGINRLADVGRIEVFLEMIADRFDQRLAEGGQVGAAHGRVLAIDEGPVFLAVMVAVGERDLDVIALEMDDGVERFAAQLLGQEVLQAVLRAERFAVEREREPAIEERIVPKHVFDELGAELEVLSEERLVGREFHQRAVALAGLGDARLVLELPLHKLDHFGLALADGLRSVIERERVDRLLADAVEPDRLLEGLAVVFRPGVDDRDTVHELPERDATAVVADLDAAFGDLDLDLPALPHHELVDGVIDRLLEEDVDAILGVRAVAEPSDIHAWTETDMLQRAEGLDAGFGIVGRHRGVTAKSGRLGWSDKRNYRQAGTTFCNSSLIHRNEHQHPNQGPRWVGDSESELGLGIILKTESGVPSNPSDAVKKARLLRVPQRQGGRSSRVPSNKSHSGSNLSRYVLRLE